ncbi:MAG: nitrite/sulfite reductase [Pseudomonadota bacterium]
MYQYNDVDQQLVNERVAQFRDQTERYLSGQLTEDEYRPLRLMNGLYIQTHAPMLRVAIPYGTLSSAQLRKLAEIAWRYDRGYGHFSTRQNIQFNWPKLHEVPEILAELATVQMHAIQTSGNCVRNVTTDHLAGVAVDEIADPRPYCELLRQWSTFHPEFSYLPRKFKIAVSGARADRAAVAFHDIGLRIVSQNQGALGLQVLVGGGQGRTPRVGQVLEPFIDDRDLLSYTEAILRVYNRFGRRDNKYKARIKILVGDLGVDRFRELVREEWKRNRNSELRLTDHQLDAMKAHFKAPAYRSVARSVMLDAWRAMDPEFNRWYDRNTVAHRQPGYRVVIISLKAAHQAPGDASAKQMELIADLADRYGFSEIRVTHGQNLVLPDVLEGDLREIWRALVAEELATPNIGLLTDVICCPGKDFCHLANARSIPLARDIAERFDNLDYLHDIGDIDIKMSGCMNACGHHHVGQIGILGVEKSGKEFYQITIGGEAGNDAMLGSRLGPAIEYDRLVDAIESLVGCYLRHRDGDESFRLTFKRIGLEPFREAVYSHA